MTNQGWREHVDGLMALLLILKEGQRAFVEDNVKPFIDLEIRIAEERGRLEVIEELRKYATISPDSQTPYVDGTIIGLADDLKAKFNL